MLICGMGLVGLDEQILGVASHCPVRGVLDPVPTAAWQRCTWAGDAVEAH